MGEFGHCASAKTIQNLFSGYKLLVALREDVPDAQLGSGVACKLAPLLKNHRHRLREVYERLMRDEKVDGRPFEITVVMAAAVKKDIMDS